MVINVVNKIGEENLQKMIEENLIKCFEFKDNTELNIMYGHIKYIVDTCIERILDHVLNADEVMTIVNAKCTDYISKAFEKELEKLKEIEKLRRFTD